MSFTEKSKNILFVVIALAVFLLILAGLMIVYLILLQKKSEIELCKKWIYFEKKLSETHFNNIDLSKDDAAEFNDLFDKIYVISLPNRKQKILQNLKTFQIRPEIVDAIKGDDLPNRSELIQSGVVSTSYSYKNKNEVACCLSHKKALERFLESDAETAVIFEDNVLPCKNAKLHKKRRVTLLLNELKSKRIDKQWDILFLGHYYTKCKKLNQKSLQIYAGGSPLCAHAYAINKRSAHVILKSLLPIKNSIDLTYNALGNAGGSLRTFVVMPPLFFQDNSSMDKSICSDIQWFGKEKKNGQGYRLGDMIKGHMLDANDGEIYHLNHFPDSIASEYMKRTNESNNIDILFDIVVSRRSKAVNANANANANDNALPSADTIVVHLRTGDVIDHASESVDTMLKKRVLFNSKRNYVKPLDFYRRALKHIEPLLTSDKREVVLVTGFHKGGSHKKSLEYIKKIAKFFKQRGYEVSFRINQNADDDFVFMCFSKYYIQSGGGFSRLIGNIVSKKNKGVVYFDDK